ncbi:MAG: hypothetical protein IKV99_08770 [Oscillospiraceae bacterium]|nr:hypothetical protein [Oscillospiraceae bacterium]
MKEQFLCAVLFSYRCDPCLGGILYVIHDPNEFRIVGVMASVLGYGIFFGAALHYETIDK